jgi:c-di-AMP phosphodiesterase-like protein
MEKFTPGNPYKDADLGVVKWGIRHYSSRFIGIILLIILCTIIDIANQEFFASIYSILVTVLLTVHYLHTYYTYYDLAARWEGIKKK